MKIWNYKTSR